MKKIFAQIFFLFTVILATNIYAAPVSVQIKLQQAKNIYNTMTGPDVQNEGAAGHLYRTGKSIT